MEYHITLPSKPRVVSEEGMQGIYEIDSLYPGTATRSVIAFAASFSPRFRGGRHPGEDRGRAARVRDYGGRTGDVMESLNLKRVHFVLHGDEPQTIRLSVKGTEEASRPIDFKLPSQVEIKNPEQHIADLSGKASFELEATIERGLGYVPREVLTKEKVDIGTIALDATFTPIRRVNYEVENMRVGDRTTSTACASLSRPTAPSLRARRSSSRSRS